MDKVETIRPLKSDLRVWPETPPASYYSARHNFSQA